MVQWDDSPFRRFWTIEFENQSNLWILWYIVIIITLYPCYPHLLLVLPCKRFWLLPVETSTWRDLFSFLSDHSPSCHKPVLIFANSVVEVNLLPPFAQFPQISDEILAIGTNLSIIDLSSELRSKPLQPNFFILSAQTALAAFIHGFLQIQNFSLLCFCGCPWRQSKSSLLHPYEPFYTPFWEESSNIPDIRVIGFTEEPKTLNRTCLLKETGLGPSNITRTLFTVFPMSAIVKSVIDNYLEDFTNLTTSLFSIHFRFMRQHEIMWIWITQLSRNWV